MRDSANANMYNYFCDGVQDVNVSMIGNYFTGEFRQPRSTNIFFKGLVLYTFLKILFVWKVSAVMLQYHNPSRPGSFGGKVLLFPALLAEMHVHVFYIAALVFLSVAFFLKAYYILRLLFFYLTFNLYVLNLPLANGSDMVLFMLGFWCILTGRLPSITIKGNSKNSTYPSLLEEGAGVEVNKAMVFRDALNGNMDIQKVIFNLGVVLCQIQIVNVYLVSGVDKLLNKTWRSGEAFAYITHLDFFYNPVLPKMFTGNTWDFIFSWGTILFELLFVVLVWMKRTRLTIIVIGVFFNIFIWVILSIPDFALLMIVSFLIFLKDEDYQTVSKLLRR